MHSIFTNLCEREHGCPIGHLWPRFLVSWQSRASADGGHRDELVISAMSRIEGWSDLVQDT